jgi:hypothetical protein
LEQSLLLRVSSIGTMMMGFSFYLSRMYLYLSSVYLVNMALLYFELFLQASVRDAAMNTLVEIYRHVGERVRVDLQRKGQKLLKKFHFYRPVHNLGDPDRIVQIRLQVEFCS